MKKKQTCKTWQCIDLLQTLQNLPQTDAFASCPTLNPKAALAPASQALERVPDTPMVSVKMN